MNALLIPVAVVALVTALAMGLFLVIRGVIERRRSFWRRRLHGADEEGASLLVAEALPKPAEGWVERMDQGFDQMVKETGSGWSADQALGIMALTSVVCGGLLWLWRGDLYLTTLGLLLGVTLPLSIFLVLRARWRRGLQAQLPDAFFLLARSLRAGESLEQAMETVAEHGTRPLAGEFRRAVDRIKLGLSVPAALRGMARRINLLDFNIFVTAVTLHRTVGGNLTQLLDRVASNTRDRNVFRGYVQAATALSRITGFFIAAAAPVLFIAYALWQPDFVGRFMQSSGGVRALWVALGLEIIGALWMYRLLRTDY